MLTTPPIPRQTVGRTFVTAMSVLGAVALAQIGAVCWAVIARAPAADHGASADAGKTHPNLLASGTVGKVHGDGEPGQLDAQDVFAPGPGDRSTAQGPSSPQAHSPQLQALLSNGVSGTTAMPSLPSQAATPAVEGTSQQTTGPQDFAMLARPTPVPSSNRQLPPNTEARITELVEQARILRERGDTGTALTRLREGLAIAPASPMVISELAITYERMGITDKALEFWRQIYEMGDAAGIYYETADAKIKALDAEARAETQQASAAQQEKDTGVQPGSVLGLGEVTQTDEEDPAASRKFNLKIPVKSRPNTQIDMQSVVIQVLFYDLLDDRNVVQTDANVSYRWSTPPVDWAEGQEVLDVEYIQPKQNPKIRENRKYFGYVVRVYYKKELQDMRADPVKLLKQFPPPLQLENTE